MKAAPSSRPICAFCARDLAEVEFLFRSAIGGEPAAICDACVAERMAWLVLNKQAPGFLAGVEEMQRAALAKRWRDEHPTAADTAL